MRNLPLLVFATGLLSGMVYLNYLKTNAISAYSEEERVAIHLTAGHGFLSPFDPSPTAPPSSWCPPVYPIIISDVYLVLGIRTPAAILTILGFNLLCRAAAGVAVFYLGRKLYGAAAGLIAAGLFLINPIFWQAAGIPWDNSLALALFLWLLVAALQMRPRPAPLAHWILLGSASALLALTNAAYGLSIPLIFFIATPAGPPPLHLKRNFAAALAAFLLILLPWTAHNYAQFHRIFFIRGNLYTELWLGNQPISTGWMTSINLQSHPSENPENRQQVLTLGETAYFDLCRRRFRDEYAADPAQFWRRCAFRFAYLFIGEPQRPWLPLHLALSALGLTGAWSVARHRLPGRAILAAGFLACVPYLPTQVHDRYVMPLRAILSLLAAHLIGRAIQSSRYNKTSPAAAPPAEDKRIQFPTTTAG